MSGALHRLGMDAMVKPWHDDSYGFAWHGEENGRRALSAQRDAIRFAWHPKPGRMMQEEESHEHDYGSWAKDL